MQIAEILESKSVEKLEAWFLDALESDPLPLEHMLAVLRHLAGTGAPGQAAELASLAMDVLAGKEDARGALSLMADWCAWQGHEPGFRKTCHETLTRVFTDRTDAAFVKSCGFDGDAPAGECLRRLHVLHGLVPGSFCYDKTWGFGIVRRVDEFYLKITIDFDGKKGHQMSFSYAAEALKLLGEEHLLVMKHTNPAGLAELAAKDPGEVVRIALRSYGPMPAPRLREVLVSGIIEEPGWKTFWDGARKALKADPRVDIPARRSEPIRLLEREKYGDDWFAALGRERDVGRIVELAAELEGELRGKPLQAENVEVVADRLGFVIRGAEKNREHLVARSLMSVDRLFGDGDDGVPGLAGHAERMYDGQVFLAASAGLAARDVRPFLEYLAARDRERTLGMIPGLLPGMRLNVLGEALDYLAAEGREEQCADVLRPLVAARESGVQVIYWLCRHPDAADRWLLTNPADLLKQAVECLESPCSGDALKAQNQLRRLFEQGEWLKGWLQRLDDRDRVELFTRIRDSRGWEAAARRSVMGRMIKQYPDLERVAEEGESVDEKTAASARMTSWRTYRERQEQLRKLLDETIPANSREIGVARSYGDLSENFEYQAAKDQQRILMQKQRELERDLREVNGTGFENCATDKVGPGTCVILEKADGQTARYCILGEWDRDEGLDIIASASRLAQALRGHVAGDRVTIPSENAEEECTVTEISGLSDEVKTWIAGGVSRQ